ncbi:unnamed protein product [Phytomonas sp. EM1]|nr:unnamed protein product [Phytomonas sp. EM1]|eukprot:CCW65335.1 unnamed protein product [Phytomonas sp. isolate EM1]
MRAAKLPSCMAVSKILPDRHFIITAVDNCASYQYFLQQLSQQRQTSLLSETKSDSSVAKHYFSIDNLVPEDMTSLLVLCRAITYPTGSFNFSFQGNPSTSSCSVSASNSQDGPDAAVRRLAYLHVVERAAGDFVPNNLLYDCLKCYQAEPGGSSGINGFPEFLGDAQRQLPQSAEEALEAVGWPPGSPATATPEAKLVQDPLGNDDEARRRSVVNATISLASPNASNVFTFYPYAVSVEASIPYRSEYFCVMVNLKPILPHHLMVVPLRCVGTIHGLTDEEVKDWGQTMVLTFRVLNEVHNRNRRGDAPLQRWENVSYCMAIQQGTESGQTVPHLHTHIIPFSSPEDLGVSPDSDENLSPRIPRTKQEMWEETAFLRPFFTKLAETII